MDLVTSVLVFVPIGASKVDPGRIWIDLVFVLLQLKKGGVAKAKGEGEKEKECITECKRTVMG